MLSFSLGQDITFDEVTATIQISDENNNSPVFTQTHFIGGEDAVMSFFKINVQKLVFYVIYQTQKTVFDRISKLENTTRSRVFLTTFEVFENVVKHGFDISFQSKLKLRRKRRNEIAKIYAN